MPLALTWALVTGCAAITDSELAERMDRDGDGDVAIQWGGTDCDDDDPARNDDAVEICNGFDDDCSGTVDDVAAPEGETFYLDLDHDDVGGEAVQACALPNQAVRTGGDCNDDDIDVHPGADEECNGIDDDCDGLVDFDDDLEDPTWFRDADGDGYGLETGVKVAPGCTPPTGYAAAAGDCNDANAAVNPDEQEVCNGYDDDCDALVDSADGSLDGDHYYPDADNDGFGSAVGTPVVACTEPFGHELSASDCDDTNAAVNAEAIEVCNGRDDNCVGEEEDAVDRTIWYVDGDGDWYGAVKAIESCFAPDDGTSYTAWGGDCDDGDAAFHPYAYEECGTTDYNCDGSTGKVDADHDGYNACDECNDADPAINPSADETCAAGDENCNGREGDEDEYTLPKSKAAWYPDVDGDYYGDAIASPTYACVAPANTVADNTDCNDGDPVAHPGAAEIWYFGGDENCDGWWSDYDQDYDYQESDDWGGPDCDDENPYVYVGAHDGWYTGVDENCDDANDWDQDGDGYDTNAFWWYAGDDCDDTNAGINPGAYEDIFTFHTDDNCNGSLIY